MPAKQFTVAFLKERVAYYRDVFLGDGTATAEELDPYFPGGAENPHTGQDAYILAYGRCLWALGRVIGREQAHEESSRLPEHDLTKLKALHSEPESIELTPASADQAPRTVIVYPKSGLGLEHIGAAALIAAHLTDQIATLEEHGDARDLEVIVEARTQAGYFHRLACWIATHPGAGLPYPRGVKHPELPAEIDALNPIDYYLIAQACTRVNATRLRALDASQSSKERPDWPGFYVGAASELKTSVALLWETVPLAEIAATANERARIHEEARERAKRERQAGEA